MFILSSFLWKRVVIWVLLFVYFWFSSWRSIIYDRRIVIPLTSLTQPHFVLVQGFLSTSVVIFVYESLTDELFVYFWQLFFSFKYLVYRYYQIIKHLTTKQSQCSYECISKINWKFNTIWKLYWLIYEILGRDG